MLTLSNLIVYVTEGFAIAGAAYLLSKRTLNLPELGTLAITVAATFAVLDMFAPAVGQSARQGSGFGLGAQMVGFGQVGGANNTGIVEGMDDRVAYQYYNRYNPPYAPAVFPPTISTLDVDQGAPRTLEPQNLAKQEPNASQAVLNLNQSPVQVPNQPVANQTHFRRFTQANPNVALQENDYREHFPETGSPVSENLDGSCQAPDPAYSVQPASLVDYEGSPYEMGPPEILPVETKFLNNSLEPKNGSRNRLPPGWDQLEQPNLGQNLNKFRNETVNPKSCQVGPYGPNGEYDANYQYPIPAPMQKKNL